MNWPRSTADAKAVRCAKARASNVRWCPEPVLGGVPKGLGEEGWIEPFRRRPAGRTAAILRLLPTSLPRGCLPAMTPSTMARLRGVRLYIQAVLPQVASARGRSRHGDWSGPAASRPRSGDRARSGQPAGPGLRTGGPAAPSALAVGLDLNSFTSALGAHHVPIVATVEQAPPGLAGEIALVVPMASRTAPITAPCSRGCRLGPGQTSVRQVSRVHSRAAAIARCLEWGVQHSRPRARRRTTARCREGQAVCAQVLARAWPSPMRRSVDGEDQARNKRVGEGGSGVTGVFKRRRAPSVKARERRKRRRFLR